MFDARTFPDKLEGARKILTEQNATYKGEYEIHDYIFSSKDPQQNLGTIFLRLRAVPVSIWNEKNFIVALKNTELQKIGKKSHIPVKEQFDSEVEAREFIRMHYSETFEPAFDFERIGWQYDLSVGDQVDLEDIQGHYSIEFKSKTEQGLQHLLDIFHVRPEEVIQGPSVVVIRDWLKA